jgi:DNA-binding NarL/FixJ family response regulator
MYRFFAHSKQEQRGYLPSYEIAEHATDDALTPAEINVLRLIAAGNANKQIADQLSITEETVKGRVKNILPAGAAMGWYPDSNFVFHGFVRTP